MVAAVLSFFQFGAAGVYTVCVTGSCRREADENMPARINQ